MIRIITFTFILIFSSINFLSAQDYFLTLRYNNVNLRQGPSKDYPIKIFYKKKYLPILILDTSGNWRKIKEQRREEKKQAQREDAQRQAEQKEEPSENDK